MIRIVHAYRQELWSKENGPLTMFGTENKCIILLVFSTTRRSFPRLRESS